MAEQIQDNYPSGLSDEELLSKIADINKLVTRVTKPGSTASLGTNYYISMMEIGQYELTKRIQAKLLQEITSQNKSNKITQKVNWVLTGITIVLAFITIFFGYSSLDYAKSDLESDTLWQMEQIQELRNQNTELQKINLSLQKMVLNDSIVSKIIIRK